jgi:hypothetical protein
VDELMNAWHMWPSITQACLNCMRTQRFHSNSFRILQPNSDSEKDGIKISEQQKEFDTLTAAQLLSYILFLCG